MSRDVVTALWTVAGGAALVGAGVALLVFYVSDFSETGRAGADAVKAGGWAALLLGVAIAGAGIVTAIARAVGRN